MAFCLRRGTPVLVVFLIYFISFFFFLFFVVVVVVVVVVFLMFVLDSTDRASPSLRRKIEIMVLFYTVCNLGYCWFSHDVTKFRASEILVVLRFYFHDV